jgi:hypothetical protein
MVRYWLELRTNPRSTGIITMGSYVTYIGHKLGIQFDGDDIYRIPPVMDDWAQSEILLGFRGHAGARAADPRLHLFRGRSDMVARVPHGRSSRHTNTPTFYATHQRLHAGHPEHVRTASSQSFTWDARYFIWLCCF